MNHTLFVIDLETTGLHPATSRIVEIGCVALREGRLHDRPFSTLVAPGEDALSDKEREILGISGIRPDELTGAPDLGLAIGSLCFWAAEAAGPPPWRVTSYNVPFDAAFLRWDSSELAAFQANFVWAECVMRRAALAAGGIGLRPRLSLAAACARYQIRNDHAHRALSDAKAAAAVWLALEAER